MDFGLKNLKLEGLFIIDCFRTEEVLVLVLEGLGLGVDLLEEVIDVDELDGMFSCL